MIIINFNIKLSLFTRTRLMTINLIPRASFVTTIPILIVEGEWSRKFKRGLNINSSMILRVRSPKFPKKS